VKLGTRSVLFGVHQFLIHPWFVAAAWCRLYGFPLDPRLWVAFFVHDLGYIGKPNMDGPEGDLHPYLGARIMGAIFGRYWYEFCLYHSRFLAKKEAKHISQLCIADKLAIVLTPAWLYIPMARLTGEIKEYMALADTRGKDDNKYAFMQVHSKDRQVWFWNVKEYLRAWVAEHKDGRKDTWTPVVGKTAKDKSGVWK